MASIRLPKMAEPLLQFCRTQDSSDAPCIFATYAELITFAAALGYYESGGGKPMDKVEPLRPGPDPIDLDIFRRGRLQPTLLLIGLACDQNLAVAKEEDRLAKIIEGYAHEGFLKMQAVLKQCTPSSFHEELIDLMRETQNADEQVAI